MDLKRISAADIPPAKRWDIGAAWDTELDRVTAWLRSRAGSNYSKFRSFQEAQSAGLALPAEIDAIFGNEVIVDPEVLLAANRGDFGRDAPPRALIITLNLFKWMLMSAEAGVFFLQWLFGLGNILLILVGLLLAAGAYFVGHGFGDLLCGNKEARRSLLSIGAGTTIVSLLIAWRAFAAGSQWQGAVVLPLVLALAVIVSEALYLYYSTRWKALNNEMFRAQIWVSVDRFRKASKEGLWEKIYIGALEAYKDAVDNI